MLPKSLPSVLLAVLAASLLVVAAGCMSTSSGPRPGVLLSVVARGDTGPPVAFVRSNLRQTLAVGSVALDADILTSEGIPIYAHRVAAGRVLWIDRDADQRLELAVGDPLPPAAAVLFPGPEDAQRFGVSFLPIEP